MTNRQQYSDQSYYNGGYRYFFNGQESDGEVYGTGSLHAFEYRMHDTRIGRFWSVDPLAGKFPWNSAYAFAENQVVEGRELEGLEVYYTTTEFGSAMGVGEHGLKFVRGQGRAKDKIGITYFKYKSSFKTSDHFKVINHYLHYIDRGNLFNLFMDTPIKTDIKMFEVGKDQWESESYQRQMKEKQTK